MGTKEQLLTLFENNKGHYISGEDIADTLSISRTAVWKAVKTLQNEGYHIYAVRNKGYCLSIDTDILSRQGIQKYLKPICSELHLEVVSSLPSTNEEVRKLALSGMPEGYTLIANSQTNGKGRRGRPFYSPSDTGIYMSILLRPHQYSSRQAVTITTMAAVAICEAIEIVSGKKAEIKWVNDIYMDGKKVCGILTEASLNLEDDLLEYAVLGIGINAFLPEHGFPEEIKETAGSIFEEKQNDAKNQLVAEFLNRFLAFYSAPQQTDYIEKYRNRNFIIGKKIHILSSGEPKEALALAIDNNCQLIVKYNDDTIEHLHSGEISIQIS